MKIKVYFFTLFFLFVMIALEIQSQNVRKLVIYVCPYWDYVSSISYNNNRERSVMKIIIRKNYPFNNGIRLDDLYDDLILNNDTVSDTKFKYEIRLELVFYLKYGKRDRFYVGTFKKYTHNKKNIVYVLNEKTFKEIMSILPERFNDVY